MNARMGLFEVAGAAVVLALAGCGGGGGSGSGGNPGSGFSISGTVAGATGVTVVLTGAKSAFTTTAANGSYAFGSLANGSYAVTPSKAGYAFNPATLSVTVNVGLQKVGTPAA